LRLRGAAGVQGLHEPGELRGGGSSQTLEPVLLWQRRERLLNEPLQLGELLLASTAGRLLSRARRTTSSSLRF
jgi:hypothetical protein